MAVMVGGSYRAVEMGSAVAKKRPALRTKQSTFSKYEGVQLG